MIIKKKDKKKGKSLYLKKHVSSRLQSKQIDALNTDDECDDYCLDRLFDPEQLHYTPMNELLKKYKKRNLISGRMFNLAKKYGTVPTIRHRVIKAPQMERAGQRIFGTENFYYPPEKVYYCTKPKLNQMNNKINQNNSIEEDENDGEERDQSDKSKSETEEETDDEENYANRLNELKKLRSQLDKLDLDVDYLQRKRDLNEIEKKVLRSMKFIDKQVQTELKFEKKLPSKRSKSVTPKLKLPTPAAMEKIETYLENNRWRLIDLFKDLDKNKDWTVYKTDLIRKFKNSNLEINDAMIDELVNAIGNHTSNKINYKAFVDGRTSHLSDRRNLLRSSRQSSRSNDEYYASTESLHGNKKQPLSFKSAANVVIQNNKELMNIKSADSKAGKSLKFDETLKMNENRKKSPMTPTTPNSLLKLPKIDTRPSHYPVQPSMSIKEDTIYESDKFRDKSISAPSSALFKNKSIEKIRIIGARSSTSNQKVDLIEAVKQKKENLLEQSEKDYRHCLRQLADDNNIGGSIRTIRNGMFAPQEHSYAEILASLNKKATKARQELLLVAKEDKMLRRQKRQSLISGDS